MHHVSHKFFAIAAVLVVALAGCAGQPNDSKKIVSGDDYEYVTPLGSNIPVRVKKGEKPVTASPTKRRAHCTAAAVRWARCPDKSPNSSQPQHGPETVSNIFPPTNSSCHLHSPPAR